MIKKMTLFCCMLFIVMFASCEQRDPQAEYATLRETVFSSPRDGEVAAQEYIDYFSGKKGARITEVSEIRSQYRQMDDFFSKSYSNYADYLNQSREINRELSRSIYEGVRKMWLELYERERSRLLGPLMDQITESNFDSFFKTQVKNLCESEFNIWEVESIDQVHLSTPTLINDGTAKKAQGEYRVHLRGGVIGLITREARITIEGMIGPNENGYIDYVRTSYQFLEKPILP